MKKLFSFESVKNSFFIPSGGKKVLQLKKVGIAALIFLVPVSILFSWLGPKQDLTHYHQVSWDQKIAPNQGSSQLSQAVKNLLQRGKAKVLRDKQNESSKKKRKIVILYDAPQVIEQNSRKTLPSGAKMLAFLLSPIDTRTVSLVKAQIAQNINAFGLEIKKGSLLTGGFNFNENSQKIFITFQRLDLPNGSTKKIEAQALSVKDYNPGITGETHSIRTLKTAASLGLSMLSGMADVLTEKESLGFAQNGVQAKSNMKNALLQGASRSAQEQASRFSSEIDDVKDYMTLPEGKELIIELTKELK